MPFITVPGIKGMLYVPEAVDISIKKHDCKDCFSCQMCADSRCSVCRGEKPARPGIIPCKIPEKE